MSSALSSAFPSLSLHDALPISCTSRLIARVLQIDDPCDVGPVHATPGLLGGMAAGLWAPMIPNGFHGYSVHFMAQFVGTATAIAYGLVASIVLFKVVDLLVGLRVSEDDEISGLDLAQHGMPAYPELIAAAASPRPLHVLSAVRVSQVMNQVPSVTPEDSLDHVQELMFGREIFALPVLRQNDEELCGIVTMADITKIDRAERVNVRVA